MTEHTRCRLGALLARWAPGLLIAGLVLFHAISNWIWLSRNVVIRGWDRIGSLINSLYYLQTLSKINLKTLFKAAVQDEVRPPLFGFLMSFMYRPFGVSADVAVMINVLYWIILLAATYGIGAKLRGRRLGMLATILVALTPLVFAMSRYSYFEFSVAAFTALGLYAMFASERFEKRWACALMGFAFGLGLLVKRTYLVYVGGALVVGLLQAGIPRRLGQALRSRPKIDARALLLALAGGLALAALWYFPNRDAAAGLPGASFLFPGWWFLASATLYALLLPPSPLSNLAAAGGITLSLASFWYLPYSNFMRFILEIGWGVNDPRGRTVDLTALSTYTDYLKSLTYGFSPVFTLLLILCALALLLYALWKRRRPLPKPWWNWDWWGLLATVFLGYLILSTSIYHEDRAITPLLPILAILLAGVLQALPWRRFRTALIALVLLFGVVQFFAASYEEGRWLVTKTLLPQPIFGQRSLFAWGPYLETPDSENNDPRYEIASEVLARVEAARQQQGQDSASLAIIAYSSHVNAGMFVYDQMRLYPALTVQDPAQAYPGQSLYESAFAYDYVLVLKGKNRRADVLEAENLILNEQRAAFEEVFELDTTYPLPDGSEAYLFRKLESTERGSE